MQIHGLICWWPTELVTVDSIGVKFEASIGDLKGSCWCEIAGNQMRQLVGSRPYLGNAMHAVRTQCEVLDVGKYSDPTFGPF